MTFNYVAQQDGFVCIYLTLPKRNDYYVSINGRELFKETISLPQMMAVGDVTIGDVIDIRIVCDQGENSNMTVNAAILDMKETGELKTLSETYFGSDITAE